MQKRLISPELSGTAAPPLITQQTSREEICCLSDSLLFCSVFFVHLFFFLKQLDVDLVGGADIRSLKVKFQQSPGEKQ